MNSKIEEVFEAWWKDEGKKHMSDLLISTAVEEYKELFKVAWMNGAYTFKTYG